MLGGGRRDGDGFLEPLQLRAGLHTQGDLTYRLERLDSRMWRVHHHPSGSVRSYDFRLQPREIADFAARSHELSTSPDSAFVSTLLVGRPVGDHTLVLRSRTMRQVGGDGWKTWPITELQTFAKTLSEQFLVPLDDLGPDGVERLWAKATTQDERWQARG